MTKIEKKQLYIAGIVAGIVAIVALAIPLQPVESVHGGCLALGTAFNTGLGECLPIGSKSCPFADSENHCVDTLPPSEPREDICGIDPRTGQLFVNQHWDKIIFKNNDELTERGGKPDPDTGKLRVVVEKETIMDIKVLDDPNEVEFPMLKALKRVNAEWTNKDGQDITLKDLELIDVEYAIACSLDSRIDRK